MRFLKIIGHAVGVISCLMVLPSFVIAITSAILSFNPLYITYFFTSPYARAVAVAEESGWGSGFNILLINYGAYLIAFGYTFFAIVKIYSWYQIVKKRKNSCKTCLLKRVFYFQKRKATQFEWVWFIL